jgi:diaminopimelate epimerase
MRFAKYHGIGNDFVMFADPEDRLGLSPAMVKGLCDRRFGIGADGVIRVAPGSDGAELFMDYVNSDGTLGEMCGNGIRCLAVFAREQGLTTSDQVKVGTRSGIKVVWIEGDVVRVDMGPPEFVADKIPVRAQDPLHVAISLGTDVFQATCLATGNPHAVIFVDEPDRVSVADVGPAIERHDLFPNMTNVEFAVVESPNRVRMRVWERGSGETLACGTGACASAVAARIMQGTDEKVTVVLPGGELEVEWAGSLDREAPIFLSGPVAKSFEGDVDLAAYG